MPLGSALVSTIDIDFTRAQGVNSSGKILFQPPRVAVGTTMLSTRAVVAQISNGVGSVELVRLPAGTYHVTEMIDNQEPYEYDFSLPSSAPATVQYESIAEVAPVPAIYTYVRTVNDVAPDPVTGNVVVAAGGASNLDGLSDVVIAAPANAQALVYDGTDTRWENRALVTGDISGFQAAVDARVQLIVDSAPAALDTLNELAAALGDDPNFAGSVTVSLAGKAALVHGHVVADITGLQAILDAKAALSHGHAIVDVTGLQSTLDAKQGRIVTRSQYFTSGNINPLPNTGGSWTNLAIELSIPAAVGDRIRVGLHGMRNTAANVFLDAGVVTGSAPTVIKRYLATGTNSPALEGDPGWYLSNGFINQSAPRNFVVTADDRDGANVRVAVLCRGNGTGILYASTDYPLYILLENLGPEPA